MKNFLLKTGKILLITAIFAGVIIYYGIQAYTPVVENIKKFPQFAEEFSAKVEISDLTDKYITTETIKTTRTKFEEAGLDIFTNSLVDYEKCLNVDTTETKEISLTQSEYAYICNAIISCSQYVETVSDINIDIVSKTRIYGYEKNVNNTKLIIKFDMYSLIEKMNLTEYINNRFYMVIIKTKNNALSYRINKFSYDIQEIVEGALNELISDYGYTIHDIAQNAQNYIQKIVDNFCENLNISITLTDD